MPSQRPVVIVGGGLMGAACAWSLARRGVPVTVLEQFASGHDLGSSHGSSRIVRRAYGDALYVSLSGRAFELWREVELASGTALLRMLGGLDFGRGRDPSAVAGYLAAAGVPFELLPADEAALRWPGMLFEGDVVHHPQAGTVDAQAAVDAMLALAERAGATVRHGAAARAVRQAGGGSASVELADGARVDAGCVVVAAGAWAGSLLSGLVTLPPLRVTEQAVWHFPRLDPGASPWPSVIHVGEREIYHLAGGRDGGPGDDRKIGDHGPRLDVDPAVRAARARGRGVSGDQPGAASDGASGGASGGATGGEPTATAAAEIIDYVRRWLPGLDPVPSSATTCLYTRTPSEDFLLDRVGDVVVCSPCSGHGAKFAPLVGEYVAALVLGDAAERLPDRFRLAAHASGRTGAVSL